MKINKHNLKEEEEGLWDQTVVLKPGLDTYHLCDILLVTQIPFVSIYHTCTYLCG